MTAPSELRISRLVRPGSTRLIRHALAAFVRALGVGDDRSGDIQTAVGEALANVAEHAYEGGEPGELELHAWFPDDRTLYVDVVDHGKFIERDLRPDRGFGLRVARAIVQSLSIEVGDGTRVRMVFDLSEPEQQAV